VERAEQARALVERAEQARALVERAEQARARAPELETAMEMEMETAMEMEMETAMEMAMGTAMEANSLRLGRVPARPVARRRWGYTLPELTISMAIASMIAAGFFQIFRVLTDGMKHQTQVGLYQETIRGGIQTLVRDLRLTGANPTGSSTLFDGNPSTDIALDIDKDGNTTNAVLIRLDRRSDLDENADGDSNDDVETILYHYLPTEYRLMRYVWRTAEDEGVSSSAIDDATEGEYDASPFLENVCSFSLTYLTEAGQTTTTLKQIQSAELHLGTGVAKQDCLSTNRFPRRLYANIRLRNL
jgi:type II secretory pathway pseudopilin PulG